MLLGSISLGSLRCKRFTEVRDVAREPFGAMRYERLPAIIDDVFARFVT